MLPRSLYMAYLRKRMTAYLPLLRTVYNRYMLCTCFCIFTVPNIHTFPQQVPFREPLIPLPVCQSTDVLM